MKTLVKELEFYKPIKEIFDELQNIPMSVFLDSSLENNLGRYSIIGYDPYLIVKQINNKLFVNEEERSESFEHFLSSYLKENYEENTFNLPIISGGIGYLSYEYGHKFENIKTRHKSSNSIPQAIFCFYNNFIIEDLENKRLFITSRSHDGLSSIEDLIKMDSKIEIPISNEKGVFEANFTKENYMKSIKSMIKYIIEGDIYIANMTQQLKITSKKHPYKVFEDLRINNPSPFGGYLNYGDFQIVCASPERFLKMENGLIETRPIKGTIRRGSTIEEDAKLKKELQNSEKDKSELLMIVDLERNDLNRICIPGSVKVTENFAIEEYATVFHLVSTVVGKQRPDLDIADLIKAVFPGGSIAGAPKIRAMEIIDELENDGRGIYTGSIGYMGLDGKCDFNIVIRTALHINEEYKLGVGGGITCESDPESEYEETLQKAKAILKALECI